MKIRAGLIVLILAAMIAGCGKAPADAGSSEAATADATDLQEKEREKIQDTGDNAGSGEPVLLDETMIFGEEGEDGWLITGYASDAKNIIVPEKMNDIPVTAVGEYVFAGNPIETIVFPDSVTSIGRAQFNNCCELRNVQFGAGLQEIGDLCFAMCPELETVVFPEGMKKIDGPCFNSCDSLREIYIPASVEEFGEGIPILIRKTCPNAIVVTPAGSAAEKICRENDIPVRNE